MTRRSWQVTVGLLMAVLVLSGCSAPAGSGGAPSQAAPTSRPLVGTSMGGNDVRHLTETLSVFPMAKVLRIYEPSAATTVAANPQFAAAVTYVKVHGGEVWYSFKVDPGAAWVGIVRDWVAAGVTIRWTYSHEADDPSKHLDPAAFVTTFTALIDQARPVSGPRVSEQSILTAYLLDPSRPHADPEAWYVPAARVLGFDCYNLDELPRVIAYARSKSKPYTIPELGSGNPASTTAGDAAALAFARAMVAGWRASPPLGFAWFSSTVGGKSYRLSALPLTSAFLSSL